MKRTRLNQTQRNEIHTAITEAGGVPSEFHVDGSLLRHNPTEGFIELTLRTVAIGGNPSLWDVKFWPALDRHGQLGMNERRLMAYWPVVLQEVIPHWIAALRLESEPDLWDTVSVLPPLAPGSDGDEPLDPAERDRLRLVLEEFCAEVESKLGLQADQLEALRETVDRVDAATSRIGKLSLTDLLFGALARWCTGLVLDESVKGHLAPLVRKLWVALTGDLGLPG